MSNKIIFKKGDIFYKSRDRRKYHIVKVLNEPCGKLYVVKYFGIHKRWWHYEILSQWLLDNQYLFGTLGRNRINLKK